MPTPNETKPRTLHSLVRRLSADPTFERTQSDFGARNRSARWQHQIVWTDKEMGLLCLSIVRGYPVGQMILWRKDDGVRVPIDGRQRLTDIKRFSEGQIPIPDLPRVDRELRGRRCTLQDDDSTGLLSSMRMRDRFDTYKAPNFEYDEISEDVARDIFVKLQGGKSLTKTEIGAALPGLPTDYVGDLVEPTRPVAGEWMILHPMFLVREGHTYYDGVRLGRFYPRGSCDTNDH